MGPPCMQGAPTTHMVAQLIASREPWETPLQLTAVCRGGGLAAAAAAAAEEGGAQQQPAAAAAAAAAAAVPAAAAAAACSIDPQCMQAADLYADSIWLQELIEQQKRAPLSKGAPPPAVWQLLSGQRLLKRLVLEGEGEENPSLNSEVVLEFCLMTIKGLKLLDNKSLNSEFIQVPLANTAPGIREAVLTMRHNERALFLLSPSLYLPEAANLLLPFNATAAAREMGGPQGPPEGPPWAAAASRPPLPLDQQDRIKRLQQRLQHMQQQLQQQQLQLQQQQPLGAQDAVELTGREWLMLDMTLCSFHERGTRWWGIAPDEMEEQLLQQQPQQQQQQQQQRQRQLPLQQQFPVEEIPDGLTTRDVIEAKTDMLKQSIHDEMASNPQSPLWEDLQPQLTKAHKQQQADYFEDLHGLNTPEDPSLCGSRGYLEHRLGAPINAGGYEGGPRMQGLSSVYGWQETNGAFELALLLKKGIRREHLAVELRPRHFRLKVLGKTVFEDSFLYTVDASAGPSWAITEAAVAQKALTREEVAALLRDSPAFAAAAAATAAGPSAAAAGGTSSSSSSETVPHPHTGIPVPRGFVFEGVFAPVPEAATDLSELKKLPAIVLNFNKTRNSRGMWGSCFVSV
ncbi:hypothetical protein, conserved [Eimeria tenella]|uniref:Uncharacterized protein n=1 Tax=Eimeria tenella TaxID=5802 RepID=U6L3A9_EIMTE|nr:hypothetical protein, conserved [Eimeria tenella]CDJ43089.1 hypothetical protein, conserved [Eimeria tenella]|eukprot:XP_013233839.1 hypothetical protein, conserved [Eimeria tenella]